jgi:Tol biopolymer transport system component
VRIAELRQSGVSPPVTIYDNADVEYIEPLDWSPDGMHLAISLQRVGGTGQMGLLSLRDGVLRPLKSFPWNGESISMAFSPDGRHLAYDLPSETDPGQADIYVMTADGSREAAVVTHRRNDRLVAWSRDGRHILFASDRTGSIQLWAQAVSGLDVRGEPQVVASSFSGVLAGVADDGRLFDVLTTRSASLFRIVDFDVISGRATSQPVDPGEEYFSSNLNAQAEWSPDGARLLLIRRTGVDPAGRVVTVLGPDGRKLHEVRPQLHGFAAATWARDGGAFLAMGHDLKGRGIYRTDLATGAPTAIVLAAPDEPPMTNYWVIAPSPDGRSLYYGHNTASGLRLVERQLQTGTERELASFPSPDGWISPSVWNPHLSPDGRHVLLTVPQGAGVRPMVLVSVATGEQRELAASAGELLMWTPDSAAVLIRRRPADGEPGVWRLDAATGASTRLDWNLGHDNHSFRLHPDGRRLVYVVTTSSVQSQVRVLSNVLNGLDGAR